MTWWLNVGCAGTNAGGCDPYGQAPYPYSMYAYVPVYDPVAWYYPPERVAVQQSVAPPLGAGAVVGACCGSCAVGAGCEDSCSQPAVGAIYVSDKELNDMGESVILMSSDVASAVKGESDKFATSVAAGAAMKACRAAGLRWDLVGNKCLQEEDPLGISYVPHDASAPLLKFLLERWTPFAMQWNDYASGTIHTPGGYDELVRTFKSLHDEWTVSLKQSTRAKVPPPPKEFLDTIPWGYVALAGAVVLLPFYLPALAGLYAYFTGGREKLMTMVGR